VRAGGAGVNVELADRERPQGSQVINGRDARPFSFDGVRATVIATALDEA